ncbi:WD40 repeat domain-containing protein [Streptomyces hokutonensis]|uniref:WD40 repeat domain-containing protein n=1 Tax=Streptomyces hokutonensis TaxID=1306990 RepID=UPI00035E7B53|nr:WD40 repeat domain-containing protein [Streptomyces hokutonensis]
MTDWFEQAVLAGILDALRPTPGAAPRWDLAEAYALRHAISHAVDAGRVDDLLTDPEFLVHADPETLLPELARAGVPAARLAAAVYRSSVGVHPTTDVNQRRQLLSIDALRHRAEALAGDLVQRSDAVRQPWTPHWTTDAQATPALLAKIPLPGWCNAVALADLGGRLVILAATGNVLTLWDARSAQHIGLPMEGHRDTVRAVATACLAGRTYAASGSDDHTIRLWDLVTSQHVRELDAHTAAVTALSVLPSDRPLLVSGDDNGTLLVWDLADGRDPHPLEGHQRGITSVACGRMAGRPVAATASRDNTAAVWDLESGHQLLRLEHEDWVTATAVASTGEGDLVVTGATDARIRVWDGSGGELLHTLEGQGLVNGIDVTMVEGRLHILSASHDSSMRVWDLAEGRSSVLAGHTMPVTTVATGMLDGRPVAVSGSADNTARLWDLTAGSAADQERNHTQDVRAVTIAVCDGEPVVASTGADGSIRIWNLDAGTPRAVLRPTHTVSTSTGEGEMDALTTVATGVVAVAGTDEVIRLVNIDSGRTLGTLDGHDGPVSALAAVDSLSGRQLISGGDDTYVRVWDVEHQTVRHVLSGHGDWVTSLAVSVDGQQALALSGSNDGSLLLWDVEQGVQLGRALRDDMNMVTAVGLTDIEGQLHAVAGADDGQVSIWNLYTGEVVRRLRGLHEGVKCVTVTALDGQTVAIAGGDDAALAVWHLASGRLLARIALPDRVNALTATADGRLVAGFGWEVAVLKSADLESSDSRSAAGLEAPPST